MRECNELTQLARDPGVGYFDCGLRARGGADVDGQGSTCRAEPRPNHGDCDTASGGIARRGFQILNYDRSRYGIYAGGQQQSRKYAADKTWLGTHCANAALRSVGLLHAHEKIGRPAVVWLLRSACR